MAVYALRTDGRDNRYPSQVVEADGYRRFAQVVVFVHRAAGGMREGFEIPTEFVEEIRKFTSRIDAEAWLAGRDYVLGPDAGRAGVPTTGPGDLPPLRPGPGDAPMRKLKPTPLSAVLDLTGEKVAVSPQPSVVEDVDVRVKRD